jgi:hypothetical protein
VNTEAQVIAEAIERIGFTDRSESAADALAQIAEAINNLANVLGAAPLYKLIEAIENLDLSVEVSGAAD